MRRYYCFKDFMYLFLERGVGKEKEKERNINVWLLLVCLQLGIWPSTRAYALTGNRTGDPLVCRPVLNPLSYPSQGPIVFLLNKFRMWLQYINMPHINYEVLQLYSSIELSGDMSFIQKNLI